MAISLDKPLALGIQKAALTAFRRAAAANFRSAGDLRRNSSAAHRADSRRKGSSLQISSLFERPMNGISQPKERRDIGGSTLKSCTGHLFPNRNEALDFIFIHLKNGSIP
jgi:hypothetical protein